MYSALLAVGRTAGAEAYAQVHPQLPRLERPLRVPLGRELGRGEAARWKFDPTSAQLREEAIDLSQGLHIVAYMEAQCSFSQQAARELLQDQALREVFLSRSIWVMVPGEAHSIDRYRSWAQAHPGFAVGDLPSRKNWPSRRIAAVPYFLVVRDGSVVGEVLGWLPSSPRKLKALIGL